MVPSLGGPQVANGGGGQGLLVDTLGRIINPSYRQRVAYHVSRSAGCLCWCLCVSLHVMQGTVVTARLSKHLLAYPECVRECEGVVRGGVGLAQRQRL